MNRKLLPLVVLVALVSVVGLWFALRSGGNEEGNGSGDAVAVRPEEGAGEAEEVADDPLALDVPEGEERREVALRTSLDETSELAAKGEETFDRAGAAWMEISIRLPAGHPEEHALELVAVYPGGKSQMEKVMMPYLTSEIFDGREDLDGPVEGAHVHLVRVPDTLSLRVPYPPETTRVFFGLRGRYVRFDSEEFFLPPTGPIELEPELGAWLTGRLLLPPEAAEREIEPGDFEVLVTSRLREGEEAPDDAPGGGFFLGFQGSRVEVHDDLRFEARGLDPQYVHTLNVEVEKLLDHTEEEIEVAAGEHRVLDVALLPGATISGRAIDEEGKGISSANVRYRGERRVRAFLSNSSSSSDSTDSEGRYVLWGLPAGTVTLAGSASGYLDPEDEEIELTDDQILDDHDILFPRGFSVAGTVFWPDGEVAEGAEVQVYEVDSYQSSGRDRVDAEEGFEVTGLDEGPFRLVARATKEEESAPPAPSSEEEGSETLALLGRQLEAATLEHTGHTGYTPAHGIPFRGVLENVAPGSTDLVIRLVASEAVPGLVVDDTGTPVEAFSITASPAGGEGMWSPDTVHASFQAEDGIFLLTGLYDGDWDITAAAEGYTSPDTPTTVTAPHAGEPITLTLTRQGTISGLVVDPAGAPIAGATVEFGDGEAVMGAFRFSMESPGLTDVEGRFTMENVPAGAQSLVARHDDWAVSEPVVVEPVAGGTIDDVVLRLRVGGRITGEVFDEEGNPIAGKNVNCNLGMGSMGFGDEGVVTDESGWFLFEHVDPGKVTIIARPSNQEMFTTMAADDEDMEAAMGLFGKMLMETVEIGDGEEVHVVLGYEPKAPVRIYGRVTEGGVPRTTGGVFAFAEGNAIIEGMKMGKVDEHGDYEITVDRPGDYVLSLSREAMMGMSGVNFYVTVPAAAEYRFDLEVPGGRISGRVLTPDGDPADSVSLQIMQEDGVVGISDLDESRRDSTEEDGSFRFESLTPGTYSIVVGGSPGLFQMGGSKEYGSTVVGGIVVDKDQAVEGIEIRLVGAGTVSGTVRDLAGDPISGASVFVRDEAGRLISAVSGVLTDASGKYLYEGVAPGAITVCARKGDLCCADRGPVTVREGDSAELDLELVPGATLEISLLQDGELVRGRVRVVDERGNQVNGMYSVADLETLITGGFNSKERTVGPLPPGSYVVYATTEDGKDAKKSVRVKAGQTTRKVKLRLK